LNELSTFAEICIFTAGTKEYAETIIDLLDPFHIIKRFYRDSTILTNGIYTKPLNIIKPGMDNIVLIDNLIENMQCNPEHGIVVKGFYGDMSDNSLIKLLVELRSNNPQ